MTGLGSTLFHVETGDRPVTLNAERRHGNHWRRNAETQRWKTAAAEALLERGLTTLRFERVDIRLRPFYPPKSGNLPDTGGLQPTEKAIIDALVDALIIPDDNRHHVRSIRSEAPAMSPEVARPQIVVRIDPVPIADGHPPRHTCTCRPAGRPLEETP